MSIVKTDSQHYTDIANAIRNKNGSSTAYKPSEMAKAIGDIQTSSNPVIQSLSVTENGTYTAPEGVDGYSPVTVDVQGGGDDSTLKAIIERTTTNPTLPSGLTSISRYAFYNYTNLALTSLPESITTIGERAFYGCTSLALTSLPENLTRISGGAFDQCTSLALTSLPSGLDEIGNYAFEGCTSLALTSLPENLTSISYGAFQGCIGLTTLTFKGTPTYIGPSAFDQCTNLTTINVPWAEGEVENAPWGATKATINYNYTGA